MFKCGKAILGQYIMSKLEQLFIWCVFKPNPLVQIFYLGIAVGGYYEYVKTVFMKYCPGPYLGEFHKYTGSVLMFACYYSFY